MNKKNIFFLIVFSVALSSYGQNQKDKLLLGVTIGANDPFKHYNTGSKQFGLFDEFGFFIGNYTRYTQSSTVLPPLSIDVDFMLSNRFSIYLSTVYQIHKESHRHINDAGVQTNAWSDYHHTTSLAIGFRVAWLNKPNYQMGLGLGVGGSFLNVKGKYPSTNGAGIVDMHPFFVRYIINQSWMLHADVRLMGGPLGFGESGDLAAYNLGFGVIYSFEKN
jgi:hypothetical protein